MADLDVGGLDAVEIGDRGLDQRQPVRRRGHLAVPTFCHGHVGHDQQDHVEGERVAHLGGHRQVTDVGGIEGAAEDPDAPTHGNLTHRA